MSDTRLDLPPAGNTIPPAGLPKPHLAVYVLLGVSLVLNIVLITRGDGVEAADPIAAVPAAAPIVETPASPEAAPSGPAEAAFAAQAAAEPDPAAAPAAAAPGEWVTTRRGVQHSIARTFQLALGEDGPAVAAEFARLFVWDMDMKRDLLRDDAVAAVWRKTGEGEAAEYAIAAARLKSGKKGDLRAYAYTAPGDRHPSFWRADGREVPARLRNAPIDTYEQVTALLKDRPSHAGMDFKVAVGTPLKSPKGGKVLRTNWNWRYNGNSIEIRFDDGIVAKFLHLSHTGVKPGQRVSAGDVIGKTGNTGRSTAPHLHYQLERGPKVIDPLDYHDTYHRTLPASVLPAFQAEVARLDRLLDARDDG